MIVATEAGTARTEVRRFISDAFLYGEDAEILDSESLIAGGYMDSTGVLELVTFLEERFGIKVEQEQITPDNLDRIDAIVAFVSAQLNQTQRQ